MHRYLMHSYILSFSYVQVRTKCQTYRLRSRYEHNSISIEYIEYIFCSIIVPIVKVYRMLRAFKVYLIFQLV